MKAPFIVWGVPHEKYRYCTVSGDNIAGGKLATDYLISLGREKIAFLGGPVQEKEVQDRYQGYKEALLEAGMAPDKNLIAYGDFSHSSGKTAMRHLI